MAETIGFTKINAKKDQVVFREDEPGESMFIVQSGAVGIYKEVEGEKVQLATLRNGEMFGEMAIIDGRKRMAEAIAVEESVLLQVPRHLLEQKMESLEPFMKALVEVLVNNLRSVHQSYMRRARSVSDYMNAIQFNNTGFKNYMGMGKNREISYDVLTELAKIDDALAKLRSLLKNHEDQRDTVLTEADLSDREM